MQATPILATLEALYDEHSGDIYRWMLGMLGRREEAEDAVQAVYLKLARRADRLTEVSDLPAYLWTAARHHVRSVLRRRALERWRTPALDDETVDLLPAAKNPSVPVDELREVAQAVERLTPRLRAVVLLVGFAGCTVDEAGRRLGIPRGTAASRYSAALERLRYLMRVTR